MSFSKANALLLLAALSVVPALAVADVAQPIPNAQRLYATPSAGLPSAQIETLVAPIALYPDALLSQVLVASTYPLEVVEARQWLDRHRDLQGEPLMAEAREQGWDASVQSLVAFPDVLDTLSQDVGWTSSLGDAFLAQEAEVMAAVQRLRADAQSSGKLVSTSEQRVTEEVREGQTIVQIVPASPEVIYVPQYDPYYVWGAPAGWAYPSLSYRTGYGFSVGINVGYWFGGWTWGWGWGWSPNWYGGNVWVNGAWFNHCGYRYAHYDSRRHGYHGGYGHGGSGGRYGGSPGGGHGRPGGSGDRMTWGHDPGHRQGVPYTSGRVSTRFEAASRASRSIRSEAGGRSRSEAGPLAGERMSKYGTRARADQGWRNPGDASRRRESTSPDRLAARGSTSESWRSSGSSQRSLDAGRRSPTSLRSTDSLRRPTAPERSGDSGWRNPVASPRANGTSPRSSITKDQPSSRGSSQGYRTAPRGGSTEGSGGFFGGGRSGSAGPGPRSSSGSVGPRESSRGPSGGSSMGSSSRGSSRGSSGGGSSRGSSGGGSRSGGSSSGSGHRGGGGRH